mgnify:CR=1 FL=1
MARVCAICGKGSISGNSIVRRGMAKKKGGIGLHTTGINKRKFKPNLHKVKVTEKGVTVRKMVCARCIKAGKTLAS